MKTRTHNLLLALTLISTVGPQLATGLAQGTAFTYEGRLDDNGAPANGSYDLTFSLFDAATGGTLVAGPLTNSATPVSSGLFSVTLDYGAAAFPGADRWLEIGVRTNGSGAFATLSPRQQITATPYAITAGNLTGIVGAANIANGTISSGMLATGAVGANQLAAGAVTSTALADGSVTAAKMGTVSGTNWVTLAINNPTPGNLDFFGYSVAGVGSNRVLIGSQGDDTGATDAGAAYLFSIDGALLITFTNPTPAASDFFGYPVAALGSDRVLIGAQQGDAGATDAGEAYLFSVSGTLLTTFTNPTPVAGDRFGSALAAVGNDRVLIGASGDATGAGAAYLFSTNGALLATFTNPAPADFDLFGIAVAGVGNDRVIIGADSDDTGANDAGAAYLFSTAGALLNTITNPTPAASEYFGGAVAALGSDRVIIAARLDDLTGPNAGAVYVYSTNGTLLNTITNPTPLAGFGPNFGWAVAAVGSDRVLVGANLGDAGGVDFGSAYLFRTNGTVLATFTNSTASSFGNSVAALGPNRVVIGAPGDDAGAPDAGSAYLFSVETYTDGLIADGVRVGSIITASLADGSVTAAKLDPSIGVWTRSGNNVFRETGNVGIGTNAPNSRLDVRGDVRLGANSEFLAPGGLENLRIIRGVVSAAGTILAGQGFSVSHPGTGFYTVMFTSFTGFPTIVATVQSGLARKITSTNVGNGLAEIRVWDDAAANVDAQFHFIAVGPR